MRAQVFCFDNPLTDELSFVDVARGLFEGKFKFTKDSSPNILILEGKGDRVLIRVTNEFIRQTVYVEEEGETIHRNQTSITLKQALEDIAALGEQRNPHWNIFSSSSNLVLLNRAAGDFKETCAFAYV